MITNKKTKLDIVEIIKSFIVGIIPVTIVRLIMESGLHLKNALLNSIIMIGMIGIIYKLRERIKSGLNNDLSLVILTIIFFPSGLYYLWKYSKRTKTFKVGITILIIGVIIIGGFIANN